MSPHSSNGSYEDEDPGPPENCTKEEANAC
jgi:hypothetical protein